MNWKFKYRRITLCTILRNRDRTMLLEDTLTMHHPSIASSLSNSITFPCSYHVVKPNDQGCKDDIKYQGMKKMHTKGLDLLGVSTNLVAALSVPRRSRYLLLAQHILSPSLNSVYCIVCSRLWNWLVIRPPPMIFALITLEVVLSTTHFGHRVYRVRRLTPCLRNMITRVTWVHDCRNIEPLKKHRWNLKSGENKTNNFQSLVTVVTKYM